MSTISPWHRSDELNRATRTRNRLGTAAAIALFGIIGATAGAEMAHAQTSDPPCGFDVYQNTLSVTSLSVRGDVHVWLKGRDQEVRALRYITPGEFDYEDYRLKRRHTNDDFQIAIVERGKKHNDERVHWCEPA